MKSRAAGSNGSGVGAPVAHPAPAGRSCTVRTVVSGSTVGLREIGSRIRSGGKRLGRPEHDRIPAGVPAASCGALISRSCFGILAIMRSDPGVRSQARRSDFADCVS